MAEWGLGSELTLWWMRSREGDEFKKGRCEDGGEIGIEFTIEPFIGMNYHTNLISIIQNGYLMAVRDEFLGQMKSQEGMSSSLGVDNQTAVVSYYQRHTATS